VKWVDTERGIQRALFKNRVLLALFTITGFSLRRLKALMHTPFGDSTLVAPHDATYLAVAGFLSRYGNLNTRTLYEIDLRIFVRWCLDHQLRPLVDVKRVHVELFGRHLEEIRHNGPSTVAHRLNVVKTFYDYCEIDELITRNPARHVRLPKVWVDDMKKIGLDRYEVGALLQQARATDPTRYALVVLMAMCGLRVSEACNVQIEDFHDRQIQGHRTLSIMGKGDKPATLPLPPSVYLALRDAADGRTRGSLLRRASGEQLDRRTAARWVKALAKRAGITKHVHPHLLRNSYVTNSLDAGVPLRDVQAGARHEDPRTTYRYDLARKNLDRHANHTLAAYLAVG